jgi:GNAT superfamily N-acetyltransferase
VILFDFELGNLLGSLAALLKMNSHDDYLLIKNVAVSPFYQGKGLGSRLLHHAGGFVHPVNVSICRLNLLRIFGHKYPRPELQNKQKTYANE